MNHVERIPIPELSRSLSKCIIMASLPDRDQSWRNPHARVVSLVLKTVVEEPVSSLLHHQLASPSDYEGAARRFYAISDARISPDKEAPCPS